MPMRTLILAALIALGAEVPVESAEYSIEAPSGGDCVELGGFWVPSGAICAFDDFHPLAISDSDRLTLDASAQITLLSGTVHGNYGILDNYGLIENFAQLQWFSFQNGFSGTINNHPGGRIENHGLLQSNGAIHNLAGATISTDGTLDNYATLVNAGTLSNAGVTNNVGVLVIVCPGTIEGNSVQIFPPTSQIELSKDRITWCGVPGLLYDVVQGDLGVLRFSGDFAQATEICLADDFPPSEVDVSTSPDPGQGFWFVLRTAGGSYDIGGPFEPAERDNGITGSGEDCPS